MVRTQTHSPPLLGRPGLASFESRTEDAEPRRHLEGESQVRHSGHNAAMVFPVWSLGPLTCLFESWRGRRRVKLTVHRAFGVPTAHAGPNQIAGERALSTTSFGAMDETLDNPVLS